MTLRVAHEDASGNNIVSSMLGKDILSILKASVTCFTL